MTQASSSENHSNVPTRPSNFGGEGTVTAKRNKRKYYEMTLDDEMTDTLKNKIRKAKSSKEFHENRKATITVLNRESEIIKSVMNDITVIQKYLLSMIKWAHPELTTETILHLTQMDKVVDDTEVAGVYVDDNHGIQLYW